MTEHTPFPWTLTANSWQYTSIYDAGGHVVCRLDLDDWGVTEESQDRLEKAQAEAAAFIVKAVNSHDVLVKALEKVRSYNVDIAAERINYRPHDHIQVIDETLASIKESA